MVNLHKSTMLTRSEASVAFTNKIKYFIPKPFQMTVLATVFLLLIYSLLRMGFVIYNQSCFAGIHHGQMAIAFINGLKFDLSGLLMLNAVIFGIYNFPTHPTRNRWLQQSLFVLFYLINLIGIFLTFVDYAYYPVAFRRITYEPFVLHGETLTMLSMMMTDYWPSLLLMLVFGAGFILISNKLFSFLGRKILYQSNFFRESLFFILLIGLIVFGIRGGLQSQPIRQSHAFFSSDRSLGYIALNTPFDIIISLNQKYPVEQLLLIDKNESRKIVKNMLYEPYEKNINIEYSFLRESVTSGKPLNYNLIILIMESWSADQLGAFGASSSATPFFDQLASGGLLFTNFVSNGQRSVEILPAILSSLPHVFNIPLINSFSEINGFIGMGTIFYRHGYTTSFHHGAKTGSMGFDGYAKLAGFNNFYGKENFPYHSAADSDIWGIYDHKFFSDTIKQLNSFHRPFCSAVYSLSPHDPLLIPDEFRQRFAPFSPEGKYRQALRYSDYSLQLFFEQAQKQSWFGNTIFVIVGDHPYDAAQNDFRSTFHVPLLIYAPGIVSPGRDDRIASQVDILPTLLNLFQFADIHASMGRSLLQLSEERFAIVKYGKQYGLMTDDFVFLSDLENVEGLFSYRIDPKLTKNLIETMPDQAARLKKRMSAYLQEVTAAVKQNKICRSEDLIRHLKK